MEEKNIRRIFVVAFLGVLLIGAMLITTKSQAEEIPGKAQLSVDFNNEIDRTEDYKDELAVDITQDELDVTTFIDTEVEWRPSSYSATDSTSFTPITEEEKAVEQLDYELPATRMPNSVRKIVNINYEEDAPSKN